MRMVWLLVASLATVVACADIAFEVKDVEAHQRYPWNGKVGIDFTIDSAVEGSNFAVRVEAKDTVGQTNITLTTMRYDDKIALSSLGKLPAGRHRVTWDADTDALDVLIPSLAFSVSVWTVGETVPDNGLYMVIDLSSSTTNDGTIVRFPISYLSAIPKDGWTDEYKTTKLVLRRIPAGTDPLGRYSLSKDFYAGIFKMTVAQWSLVMEGGGTSLNLRSVSGVSHTTIRGTANPLSGEVDSSSFLGQLRIKTGMQGFDLPTEAQWEYACRAGTMTEYNNGRDDAIGVNVVDANGVSVGRGLPNAWGLYDMHGTNVLEWCRDYYDRFSDEFLSGPDPVGTSQSGAPYRVLRGGPSSNRTGTDQGSRYFESSTYRCYYGFRLFMTLR